MTLIPTPQEPDPRPAPSYSHRTGDFFCVCPAHHGQGRRYETELGLRIHIGQVLGGMEEEPRTCEHEIRLPRTGGFVVRFDVRSRMPTDLSAWRRE